MHTIEPGGFDTGITDMGKLGQAMKKAYERAPEELKAVYGGNVSRWCKYNPSDKSAYWKTIFFISHPKHNVVGSQKNRLNETVLLSTQNICLN